MFPGSMMSSPAPYDPPVHETLPPEPPSHVVTVSTGTTPAGVGDGGAQGPCGDGTYPGESEKQGGIDGVAVGVSVAVDVGVAEGAAVGEGSGVAARVAVADGDELGCDDVLGDAAQAVSRRHAAPAQAITNRVETPVCVITKMELGASWRSYAKIRGTPFAFP